MLHNTQTIATLAGCSPKRVRNALKAGHIPKPDVNSERLFLWSEPVGSAVADLLRAKRKLRPGCSISELALAIGVSRFTVYLWIRHHHIPPPNLFHGNAGIGWRYTDELACQIVGNPPRLGGNKPCKR